MTAQEKQNWGSEHVDFSGYVKYLNTSSFTSLDSIGNDNLIHNRLNFKMYANDNLTLAIELRNRIFWGTSVKSIPDYASMVENSNQDIVQTNDKKTTIVHNHYYGGNKEMAKFMDQLLKEQQNNLNKNQSALVDQGTCTALNEKLSNKSLAEVKNDRFLADLKNKCDQHAFSQSTCKVTPTQDQTALLGTLLEESKNTKYGSIVAK